MYRYPFFQEAFPDHKLSLFWILLSIVPISMEQRRTMGRPLDQVGNLIWYLDSVIYGLWSLGRVNYSDLLNFNVHANNVKLKGLTLENAILLHGGIYTKRRHMQDKEPKKGLSKERYSSDCKELYRCGMATSLESGSAFPKTSSAYHS